MAQRPICLTVSSCCIDLRLDQFVAQQLPEHSRSRVARLIHEGLIRVNDRPAKAGLRLREGDTVCATFPTPQPAAVNAEAMALSILHEDESLIVINKPAGLVVHPAPGHANGTLVNALLHHCPSIERIGGEIRYGIVHRLDKDTSGVIVAAKNALALEHLSAQFKARRVAKTYLGLVRGSLKEESGRVDLPVGRHPVDRKKMSVRSRRPREALSLWRVRERYGSSCLLEVDLMTGRTHQIRVHCAALGHPILGDRVYGDHRTAKPPVLPFPVQRQMLHAWRLRIVHPIRGETMYFEAPVPPDMALLIHALRRLTGMDDQAAFSSGL